MISNSGDDGLKKIQTRTDFIDFLDKKANINSAKAHGLAMRVYKIDYNKIESAKIEIESCKCCGMFLPTKDYVDQFELSSEISDVGVGIVLYFKYIKFMIFILFATFFMISLITINQFRTYNNELFTVCKNNYTVILANNCSSFNNKTTDFFFQISYYNMNYLNLKSGKNSYPFVDLSIINSIFLGLLYVMNYIIVIIAQNLYEENDIQNLTIEDYTVIISNLIKGRKSINELIDDIETDGIRPVLINICFKLEEFLKTKHNYLEVKAKIDQCNSNKVDVFDSGWCMKTEKLADLEAQMKELNQTLDKFTDKFKNHTVESDLYCGVAFCSFSTIKDSRIFYESYPHSIISYIWAYLRFFFMNIIFSCCFTEIRKINNKKKISYSVNKAFEPNEVIWPNLEYSEVGRFIRKIFLFIVSFILIMIGFAIIFGLNYYQSIIKSNLNYNQNYKYLASALISLTVQVIIYLAKMMLFYITDLEKNNNLTSYYLSQSIKLTIISFIITGVVPLLNSNIMNNQENLCDDLLLIFVSNSFVTPLLILFPPDYLILMLKRKSLISIFENDPEKITITQEEANLIFEQPQIQVGYKFSYINLTILLSICYIPVFPLGSAISFLGLIFLFFVEKYNLFRFYKLPEMLNSSMTMYYFENFKINLFIASIFYYYFYQPFQFKLNLYLMIIFGILCFLPFKGFSLLNISEEEVNKIKFEVAYPDFINDYERSNPISRKKGWKTYYKSALDNGKIDKEAHDFLVSELEQSSVKHLIDKYVKESSSRTKLLQNMKKINYNNYQKNKINFGNNPLLGEFVTKMQKEKQTLGLVQPNLTNEHNKYQNGNQLSDTNNMFNYPLNFNILNQNGFNSNQNPSNYPFPNNNTVFNSNSAGFQGNNIVPLVILNDDQRNISNQINSYNYINIKN